MKVDDLMKYVLAVSAVNSIVVSMICGKITAARTFNVIDGYVKELIEIAKQSIRDTTTGGCVKGG